MKKLTWPISLPVGYMLREHVNRVRFPDWPYFFLFCNHIKMNVFFIDNDKSKIYLLYTLGVKNALINNKKTNKIYFLFI